MLGGLLVKLLKGISYVVYVPGTRVNFTFCASVGSPPVVPLRYTATLDDAVVFAPP